MCNTGLNISYIVPNKFYENLYSRILRLTNNKVCTIQYMLFSKAFSRTLVYDVYARLIIITMLRH